MTNPLAPVFNWFIALLNMMPQPIRAFISLYWALLLAVSVIMVFWRTKH